MLSLTHLQTLVEVVRLGSFTAAGNRLGYTASAVSQQMSALEKDTGLRLFVRSARSVQPTQAAHVMGQHALKLLRDADNLLAVGAAASEGTVRELRVGAFPSAASFILADVLGTKTWQEAPVNLRITIGEPSAVVPGLRSGGGLDAALVYQVGETGLVLPQGVSRHWLSDDPFDVVVPGSAGYREDERVDIRALGDLPWIIHSRGSSDASVAHSVLGNAGLHPRVAAFSDDFHATLRLVAAGHGAALVPRLALTARPAGTTVVRVPELRLDRKLILLSAEDGPANLIARLIAGCRSVLPAP